MHGNSLNSVSSFDGANQLKLVTGHRATAFARDSTVKNSI